MALENLYFNTLDREKVQGKSLGCIKGWGDTYATRSHRRGMKESHVARKPRVADPCPRATKESEVLHIHRKQLTSAMKNRMDKLNM